ncbi:cysteine desulfurase NifS [Oscillatoria laete-virens NRMC-F 0139]|nr:cysteine desulfurase NifS [Oscillatoria laete-virens]MDL5055039.1 cysteine desulfurase NifS [Oscillatoria laete-virens NRMC-F 0139]
MNIGKNDITYLDNNATTQIAPEVVEAMLPYLTDFYGNPSSAYRFGNQITLALEKVREQVAALLGADPREIVFTSCGTESDNAAISSALITQPGKKHVVISNVEHSAVKKQAEFLESQGCEVTRLPVDAAGMIPPTALEAALRPDTAIVSIMWANNETGVLLPVEEFAAICKAKNVLFHTDAVQAVGKIPINLSSSKIDMLSISGHKLHCPKGVGALFVRKRVKFQPFSIGGGQERGRRGGTENVASIVALGRACELALERMTDENTRVRKLRDDLENGLLTRIPDTGINGAASPRLPNTTSLAIANLEAEALLAHLDREGICASSGSACTTGSLEPSHVLRAMGLSDELAKGSIRLSLGFYNSQADIDKALEALPRIVGKLRGAAATAA